MNKPTRTFDGRRALAASGLLALILLPPIVTVAGQEYLLVLFSRILIYGLAAASLDLILGYGGMVSLGHAAFMGIGGYTVGILAFHAAEKLPLLQGFSYTGTENALIAWPLGIGAAMLFGLLTGAVSLRTRGMHFIMITLAFAQMLYYFFTSLGLYGGSDGLSLYSRNTLAGIELGNDTVFYYLCLAVLIIFLLLAFRLTRSRLGMVLRGSRDNEQRVQVLGFASYRYKLAFYTLAGGGAGLAGALLVNQGEFVSPGLLHWTKSGEIMIMVLLGGMGTLIGPVIGAATLLLMEEVLAMYTEHWMIFMGPFLVITVIFAKKGVYGLIAGKRGGND